MHTQREGPPQVRNPGTSNLSPSVPGTCQRSCKISSPCLKADSGACGPDSCPYCARAGAGEVELAGHEMPDSDSEAVYEFTQEAQHGDLRDPHSRRRRNLGLDVEPNSVLAFWRLICDTFRKIVDSKYFGRGIMIAILVNTLSMGIEYHEQVGCGHGHRPGGWGPSLPCLPPPVFNFLFMLPACRAGRRTRGDAAVHGDSGE